MLLVVMTALIMSITMVVNMENGVMEMICFPPHPSKWAAVPYEANHAYLPHSSTMVAIVRKIILLLIQNSEPLDGPMLLATSRAPT